jgi:hypothetical protein
MSGNRVSSRAHSSSVRSCRSSTLRVVPAPAPKIRQTGPSLRRVPARDTDPFADLAAQYIEATLGVQVERWDVTAGQGAHDLRYEHRSRLVAVEVKCVLDEDYRQMQGEIDKKEYQPYERLSRLWDVRLGHGAQIKSVRHELPDLLVLLDEIGWDSRLWQLGREFPGVAARLQALGVSGLIPLGPTEAHPPGYVLHHEGWWGFGEDAIDEPVGFACAYLTGAGGEVVTLRRQLRDAQADERHAFLFIGLEHTDGWPLRKSGSEGDEMTLSTTAPTLPEPVDGVMAGGMVEHQPRDRLASLPRLDRGQDRTAG